MFIKKLSNITRQMSTYLLPKKGFYFLGMILVRIIRYFRKITNRNLLERDYQTVTVYPGSKMGVDRLSYMGGSLYWTGFHHINEILFLKSFLRQDMVFIDVGANQGEFSIFAAKLLTQGKVIAFEPVSYSRNLLEKNKHINQFHNLEIIPCGLGNQETRLPVFTTSYDPAYAGRNDGLSSVYKTEYRNCFEEIIDITVFDTHFLTSMTRMDFVKIDIEGGELYALQGMKQSLLKFKPWILIEVGNDTIEAAGYTIDDLIHFFNDIDYSFYAIKRGVLQNSKITKFDYWGNYIVRPN